MTAPVVSAVARSVRRAASLRAVARYVTLSAIAGVIAGPLIWMILSSFKGVEELWRFPPTFLPAEPTVSGYITVFSRMPFGRYFLNSTFVSVGATILVVITSTTAGYVFAKIRFPLRNALFVLVLGSMMIPGQVTIIQNYMTMRFLGWINTYWGLIVPQGISVFTIFLMRQFMHSIPDDYLDAARVDGLSESGILLRIITPLSLGGIATVSIFGFRGSWDSLLWPLIMTTSSRMRTLTVGIAGLTTVHSPLMELLLPAATVSVLPMLVIFFIFQRQFVESAASSGLK